LSPKKKGNKKLQAGEKPDVKTASRGAGEGRACKARKMKVYRYMTSGLKTDVNKIWGEDWEVNGRKGWEWRGGGRGGGRGLEEGSEERRRPQSKCVAVWRRWEGEY
jgi:hypothetical protein